MSPELAFKLGLLLGVLDTIVKGPQELSEEEANRIRGLSVDIKKILLTPKFMQTDPSRLETA